MNCRHNWALLLRLECCVLLRTFSFCYALRFKACKMAVLATYLKSSLAIAGCVYLVYWVVSTYLSYRKLQHIKGPFLASISPLWLFYQTIRGRLNIAEYEVLQKYGSPARIGPNLIVTDDPVIFRYMSAPRSTFKRSTCTPTPSLAFHW